MRSRTTDILNRRAIAPRIGTSLGRQSHVVAEGRRRLCSESGLRPFPSEAAKHFLSALRQHRRASRDAVVVCIVGIGATENLLIGNLRQETDAEERRRPPECELCLASEWAIGLACELDRW